jgi:ubiquitin C-terminal hydrolase
MASALQMLASVCDPFVGILRNEELPAEAEVSSSTTSAEKFRLRRAFLTLMDRLSSGETVRPEEFKSAMDEKSPLFVGFRQQDSHEFLTTLLDLLDEDYKQKEEETKEDTHENDDGHENESAEADQEGKDKKEDHEDEGKKEDTHEDEDKKDEQEEEGEQADQEEGEQEDHQDQQESAQQADPEAASTWSANKRARTEEPCDMDAVLASPLQTFTALLSFSQLGVEEIGHLLHGTTPATPPRPETSMMQCMSSCSPSESSLEPRYKLVGGRMNTADVVLTRFMDERESEDTQQHQPAAFASSSSPATDNDTTSASSDIAAAREQQSNNDAAVASPVASYFTTEVRNRLTCDSCKYTRSQVETFLHLSLEIGPDSASVEDGLRRFFAPEKREIKCEKCFCATATQTSEIIKLPRALLLHLKRFIVDVSPDYSVITYRKNQSAVVFDDTLLVEEEHHGILNDFMATDCVLPQSQRQQAASSYALRSVVNHIGSSASCGHYTADAHRCYDENNDENDNNKNQQQRVWTRFNDSYVSRISAREAMEESRKTAYMVLYELE